VRTEQASEDGAAALSAKRVVGVELLEGLHVGHLG